ncbi:sodium ABC transporter permease [Pseudoalteromonas sp. MSK9-3]|uniref:ABC transporter permease n=1 Tax=Pseudoalteromonas sp. MSK9-3 TaxID=1897633 RepID=UPI000E6B8CBB|nr:ABC transporter permease [Pseudoalteromonas sp. MSK9-3]RJE77273.1 sodium ABC transporter permease [Pseudoalteromonas sp. MSK9-3]
MFEVFKKEILELLRDRKTLFFIIALPMLVFPIIVALVAFLTSQAGLKAQQQVHTYYIVNEQYADAFSEQVFYHKSFKKYQGDIKLDSVHALSEAVKLGQIDVGIFIDSDPREAIKTGKQSQWKVVFNDAKAINFTFNRINELANTSSHAVRSNALLELGVEPERQQAVLKPIVVSKVDTADKRENYGEKLGAFIPYLLLPLVLMGASYPAIDLGAGEKERGTLETLLLTPVTRSELVLGKFFTVLASSIACTLITVASLAIWVSIATRFISIDVITTAFSSVTSWDFLLIFALLLPVAAMLSSLVLAISIYARTFKEAQNYMAPLSMGIFVPIVISLLPNMELDTTTALIPITNVALAIKEIVKGTVDYGSVGLIFIASAALAALLLICCVRWFNKETVLFR